LTAFLYILLLAVPVLGAGLSVFVTRITENRLKVLLAFTAAYLLALSFLHLVPEIFEGRDPKVMGLWVMAGFFVQVLLEFFSSGIEHGHAHLHGHMHKIPFALVGGLYLHSFLEGLPLSPIFRDDASKEIFSFVAGIALHNIPIAIAFAGLLQHSHVAKGKILFYLFLFAAATPLGALAGNAFNQAQTLTPFFTAIVVGIFLHIATTIIFESSEKNHRYHVSKLLSIIAGAAVAYFLV
jgi:zinc transporter ZupT